MTDDLVERLRKRFDWSIADEAAAEIERLRADVAGKERALNFSIHDRAFERHLFDQNEKLRLENAQLRRALQEIADFPYVGTQASQKIWGIARDALEPKKP